MTCIVVSMVGYGTISYNDTKTQAGPSNPSMPLKFGGIGSYFYGGGYLQTEH